MAHKKQEKKDEQRRGATPSQRRQVNAASVSGRKTPAHRKDESSGAKRNTTKKQGNSI